MHVDDAIRLRRAVRSYTDRPVPSDVVDRLCRLALSAPTGSGAQAWSLLVVREPDVRREVAETVLAGAARYFTLMRPASPGTSSDAHEDWARGYASERLGSYHRVPVWIVAMVERRVGYPPAMESTGAADDLMSVAFAMENLMLAARAEGLGTCPTTAFWQLEGDRLRRVLGIPDTVQPVMITPLGYPDAFPAGRPPAMREFRPWRSLVHDDRYGAIRAHDVSA